MAQDESREAVEELERRYQAAVLTFGVSSQVTEGARRRWLEAKADLAARGQSREPQEGEEG